MSSFSAVLRSSLASRIAGLDAARAAAIFGMMNVNYALGLGNELGAPGAWEYNGTFLSGFVMVLSGRASATFVVLAGIGVSLGARRLLMGAEGVSGRRARVVLMKRAVLLFAFGYLWLPVWPGDILHFYGAFMLIGAALLTVRDRYLVLAAATAVAGGLAYLLTAENYFEGCSGACDILSFPGFFRELLFNGLHPVFPWAAFFILGMWLGRRNLSSRRTLLMMLAAGAAVAAAAEITGALTVGKFTGGWNVLGVFGAGEDPRLLLSARPRPPTPIYLLAASGTAVALIALVTLAVLRARGPLARPAEALAKTGQTSLTIYVAHVILGFYPLVLLAQALEVPPDNLLLMAFLGACVFMVLAIAFSVLWRQAYPRGPLEAGLRFASMQSWRPRRWRR